MGVLMEVGTEQGASSGSSDAPSWSTPQQTVWTVKVGVVHEEDLGCTVVVVPAKRFMASVVNDPDGLVAHCHVKKLSTFLW